MNLVTDHDALRIDPDENEQVWQMPWPRPEGARVIVSSLDDGRVLFDGWPWAVVAKFSEPEQLNIAPGWAREPSSIVGLTVLTHEGIAGSFTNAAIQLLLDGTPQ